MPLSDQLLLILGMTVVTYIPRCVPLLLLSSRNLSAGLMRWLEMVPPAVLAALLAQELLLRATDSGRELFLGPDNTFLLAALPTLLTGWFTRSFFGTVAVGMAAVALLRWAGPSLFP